MSENTDLTYYQKKIETWDETFNQENRDVILNRAKEYYENNEERLREQARDKYGNLSEEEKNKKKEYGKNRYCSMSEKKKQSLKEYQKNYKKNYREAKSLKIVNKIMLIVF